MSGIDLSRAETLHEMQALAPPGQENLSPEIYNGLSRYTGHLIHLSGVEAETEFERFAHVPERDLNLNHTTLTEQLNGAKIVVTGGTGCIGSVLLNELARYNPATIVSVSRGITIPTYITKGVEYTQADVRSKSALEEVLCKVKPDIIYHLAAQRDPSRAELETDRTFTTNVLGTRNVIETARASNVPQIVYASTGKAMRPFTSDVYAASKKMSEWLFSEAAEDDSVLYSGVRFTHVVDNSIILQRITQWANEVMPIRLHGSNIYFYVQSAREGAHLLLNAGLEAEAGKLKLQAIQDMELPISLTDLALGNLIKRGSSSPLYFTGYEEGYEETPYPGLYDPQSAGDLSPLINSFESPSAASSLMCPQVDTFIFKTVPSRAVREQFTRFETACLQIRTPEALRSASDELSWELLKARLAALSKPVLEHSVRLVLPYKNAASLSPEHQRTIELIEQAAAG